MNIDLDEIFSQLNIDSKKAVVTKQPVYFGGPLHQERGFVIHKPFGEFRSTLHAAEDVNVTTSRDILEALAEGKGPEQYLVALGYAGWDGQQLEKEILQNVWLSCPATSDILFKTPNEKKWEAAALSIGVDIHSLAGDAGHA